MVTDKQFIYKNEARAAVLYENPSIVHCIDRLKVIDAVEVVHANWDNNGICTLCGYPIPTDSKYDFIDKDDCLFCYHCGAKMRGGNDDG